MRNAAVDVHTVGIRILEYDNFGKVTDTAETIVEGTECISEDSGRCLYNSRNLGKQ